MSQRLFGTDGIRGKVGSPPLDDATVRRMGAALVRALPRSSDRHRLVVGRDTRESGPSIERALAEGATLAGGEVTSAGVITTPAVAFLTKALGFDAGVVISASHNPFDDNGIKIFSGVGEKFTEALERRIEETVDDRSWSVPAGRGREVTVADFTARYLAHVRRALPDPAALGPMRIALDCGNGAASALAPRLFRSFGFEVTAIGCEPDGCNINLGCGSTHPAALAAVVLEERCRLGVAFDGDGDRAIFVDHRGRVVDGDAVLLVCAKRLKESGRLPGDAIVATVMSNVGLEIALAKAGIGTVRCPVGDKHVMEEMLRRGLQLGGEQSGHVIFSEYLYTGDGLITALSVLEAMAASGRELADLAGGLVTCPQILLNVPVARRVDLAQVPAVSRAVALAESQLGGTGRLLVRYSGTEPLLRIMIEGQSEPAIRALAEAIAAEVRAHLS